MAVKQVAIRLKPEGGAEVNTVFRQAEEAGVKAATNTAVATEKATSAAERQEAQWRRNAEAIRAAGAAADAQARFNTALGVNDTRRSASDSAAVFVANDNDARRAAQIRAELDPLWGAQTRYNEALAETHRLRAAGHLTDDAAIKRQNQLQLELDQTTAALNRNTSGLTRNQLASRLNLTRQGADVAVTAAMGMNVAMIAIQQGPQILDALATSGIRLSPVMLAVGAATAAAAVGVVALAAGWAKGSSDAAAYELAASGIGRTAGLTSEQLKTLVTTHAELGEISVAAARDQAAAYLATGRIGGEVIGRLIELSRDYAAFMGVDATTATQQLAQAMLDPHKAGEQMTRTFGLLTQAELDQIEAATKSGDQMQAQALLIAALDKALEGHADKVDEASTAWQALGRWMSNVWNDLGEALYDTEQERLDRLIGMRARYERDMAGGTNLNRGQQRAYDEAGEEAWALQQRLNARSGAEEAASTAAQANQSAQLAEDRRKAAEAEARRGEAAARREAREAEQEAREQLRRDRRQVDRNAEIAGIQAAAMLDTDRVRTLQDEEALRARIRELEDDGVDAAQARATAEGEQARILSARALVQEREQAAISRAASFEADRLLGNAAQVEVEENRLDLLARIDTYVKAGRDYYAAWLSAAQDLKEVEEAHAEVMQRQVDIAARSHALNLARLSGNDGEARRLDQTARMEARAREIEAREKLDYGQGAGRAAVEISQEVGAEAEGVRREWTRGFISDIRSGGIREALASQFESAADRLFDKMIDFFFDTDWSAAFNQGGGQGGGGGDGGWLSWIGTAFSAMFGSAGKNANGTDWWGGGLSWVGERGPELVNLPRGSAVMNNERSMRLMGQAAMAPAQPSINQYYFTGNLMTPEFFADIDRRDRQAAALGARRGAESAIGVIQSSDASVRHTDRMLKG